MDFDFSDETPDRYWVTHPDKHPEFSVCGNCKGPLNLEMAVPVIKEHGGLCAKCAPTFILDHPVTSEYMNWVLNGDPRWWSMWLCNHCMGVDDEIWKESGASAE